jgi:hypothetical protein
VSWKVTVRNGPAVEHVRADGAEEALDALELHARAIANTERRDTIDTRIRQFEAGDQVAARVELRGPGVTAGVDVRGNGAVQAWTGRVRRRPLALEDEETPFDALRRAVSPPGDD